MLTYKGKSLVLDNVLVDTGSGGSIFKMDKVDELGITIEKDDIIETISGIGGSEFVYKKDVDKLQLGESEVTDFTIEVGVMDYGLAINGILGMDFLIETGAIIDLARMEITVAS
jgi:predicted aspartyl protease